MTLLQRAAKLVNLVVTPLAASSRLGGMTVISYTGRRSGREVRLPVAYRRTGDRVVVGIEFPDQKSWWRNFTGEGAPLTLQLDRTPRTGHGVYVRDDAGARVEIVLDQV